METREKQHVEVGKSRITRKKSKGNEIVDLFCIWIDWIPQSVVALYIYRVGGLIPQEILLQDLNLLKSLVVLGFHLDWSDPPVRPVGRARPATTPRPVRPVGLNCLPILVVNNNMIHIMKLGKMMECSTSHSPYV